MGRNRALVNYADQLAQDDLLLIRLLDKVQKQNWTKLRKNYSKASTRSLTGVEVTEIAVDRVEKSSKVPNRQIAMSYTPESIGRNVIIPGTPPLVGESQGGTTIALVMRTPERL
jgi:hypothetical protein